VLAATRSENPGAELSELIANSQGRIKHATINVDSNPSNQDVVPLVATALQDCGLDYLINNARVRDPRPIVDLRAWNFYLSAPQPMSSALRRLSARSYRYCAMARPRQS
jgi:NAD(P)-dependent dehydrogenase (short-subunit alcohol dehydrogenase family)